MLAKRNGTINRAERLHGSVESLLNMLNMLVGASTNGITESLMIHLSFITTMNRMNLMINPQTRCN